MKSRQTELEAFGNHFLLGESHSQRRVRTVNKPTSNTAIFLSSGYDASFDSCLLRVEGALLSSPGMRLVGAKLHTRHADRPPTPTIPLNAGTPQQCTSRLEQS